MIQDDLLEDELDPEGPSEADLAEFGDDGGVDTVECPRCGSDVCQGVDRCPACGADLGEPPDGAQNAATFVAVACFVAIVAWFVYRLLRS